MADEPESVIPPESLPDPSTEESVDPAQGDVTPVQAPDRPVENIVGEFNRKFTRLERQLEALAQMTAQQAAPRPTPPSGQLSDDDLWALAQQGDRQAFDLYMQRRASQASQAVVQQDRFARTVDAQLEVLGREYPMLHDTVHPLTQHVQQTYRALVSQGYPATRVTLLDAVKTAIVDRKDLVVEHYQQTRGLRDVSRRSAAQVAQAGQTPVASRAGVPRPANAPAKPLSKEEQALAARMGIKDPAKAKTDFLKRRETGASNLGAVANYIPAEEEL